MMAPDQDTGQVEVGAVSSTIAGRGILLAQGIDTRRSAVVAVQGNPVAEQSDTAGSHRQVVEGPRRQLRVLRPEACADIEVSKSEVRMMQMEGQVVEFQKEAEDVGKEVVRLTPCWAPPG